MNMQKLGGLLVLALPLVLFGCASAPPPQNDPATGAVAQNKVAKNEIVSPSEVPIQIKLNQLGYRPNAKKIAIVPANDALAVANTFSVVRINDKAEVLRGELSMPLYWPYSDEQVKQADFSALTAPGDYILSVAGSIDSYPFSIREQTLLEVHDATLKSFYLNRSGIEIEEVYAGEFKRAAGHSDVDVEIHPSAASVGRPAGATLSAPKGWYDAGDYGKYTVNSGIATYTLLMAYQHFGDFYKGVGLNIPESANGLPDLLDEVKWNLDWLEAMQDTDGGVYHKLTTLRFSKLSVLPKDATKQRYMIGKSVTAALNFAAVMAVASRVFKEFDHEFPGLSQRYNARAVQAWQWAENNSGAVYVQPEDVRTGAYKDKSAVDEYAWAAAELFLLTGEPRYANEFDARDVDAASNLSWSDVGALGYISLTSFGERLLSAEQFKKVNDRLLQAANQHYAVYASSAYNVAAAKEDFEWGSNSNVLNNGLLLAQAYRISGEQKYKDAALSTIDYVLGKNPLGLSFVTGFGDRSPMNIHHRPSVADGIKAPVPGFIAGGPHSGQQDKDSCAYVSDLPALSYVDHECSYATNEIAINWNAPLVYMLAAANNFD